MISSAFNRFYHGVVLKQVLQVPLLTVEDVKIGGIPFTFSPAGVANTMHGKLDSVKQLLKALNLDYPKDKEGKPLSTTKIENTDLLQHIEAVIKMCADSGHEMDFVKREYENIKLQAGILS